MARSTLSAAAIGFELFDPGHDAFRFWRTGVAWPATPNSRTSCTARAPRDAKRSRLFTRLIRELTVAARSGLPDPEQNPRLRSAVAAAKAANMGGETIERAIRRGSGAEDGEQYDEIRYEGYGPGGVAIIAEALTDNRNRTAAEIRAAFAKHGGNLGETNSVSFMFERVGAVRYPPETASADEVFEAALEAGAADLESSEDGHEVLCAPEDLNDVREALEARLASPEAASWPGARRAPSTSTRPAPKSCSDCWRRWRKTTMCSRWRPFQRRRRCHGETDRLSDTTIRLLGLDPGLRATGWGVIEADGNRLRHVADGAVRPPAEGSLAARLAALRAALARVVDTHRPDEAAVEETFVNRNPASALRLGQARGVVLLVPAEAGLPVAEYPRTSSRNPSSAPVTPTRSRSPRWSALSSR